MSMKATYKTVRLLVEAVNREMEAVRKAAMGNMALGSLNELRDLVEQLAKKAERVAVEDVQDFPPDKFVATMKPLVANYHRLLAVHNLLPNCLCEDLRVPACVVILVGDEGSMVRAAHDQNRPDMQLVVETIINALESGTKQVATEAAAATEAFSEIDQQAGAVPSYETTPLTVESIEEATRVTLEGRRDVDDEG